MITVAVTNLKGGSSKTTSAAYLAHALHEQGRRVLLVDADPQRSAVTWSELADWPLPARGLPTAGQLERELPGMARGYGADAVVIDTPPGDKDRATVAEAIRQATHVVVPCAPTPAEFERLRVLWPLVEGVPAEVAVLLTRTVPSAASTVAYRQVMTMDGWRVLRATVGRRERFAQAFGEPIVRAAQTAYGDVVAEMIEDSRVVSA